MMIIEKKHLDEIIKHAKNICKHEVCGILAGSGRKVQRIYKMKNTSDSPETCYFMDPTEQLKVMKDIRALGFEMIAIYHSHPSSGAYPSNRDVELAFYHDASYIIISLENDTPIIRAFRIADSQISEEEIRVV